MLKEPTRHTLKALERYLRCVYDAYLEYHDPDFGGGDFILMVQKFASDDFYKAHHVAVEYIIRRKS